MTAEDGLEYVVKTTRKHAAIPASEWLCHHLADACGIPTPQFTQIELMDGRIGFGSQWDESVVRDQAAISQVTSAIPGSKTLAKVFTQIYVLDLFAYNCDRHLGNYFFVKTKSGIGVKAYDFSRALIYNGWPMPSLPLPLGCATLSCYSSLRVGYPFEQSAADAATQKLSNVKQTELESWIGDMPAAWLAAQQRTALSDWWNISCPAFLQDISEGLRNGRYI